MRNPAYLFFTIIQPVMFVLLFVYVFGVAHPRSRSREGSVSFLMPGIIAQTAAFAFVGTAISLARQLQKGVIDRFRAMPMARSAVLLGRLVADTVRIIITLLVILAVGYAVGFRFQNGALPAVLMVVFGVAFGVTICTVSAFVGLAIKDEESVGSFGLVWLFPLTFVSAAFVRIFDARMAAGVRQEPTGWRRSSSTRSAHLPSVGRSASTPGRAPSGWPASSRSSCRLRCGRTDGRVDGPQSKRSVSWW